MSADVAECEHCPDGHEDPTRRPWAAYVAESRDGDGQPTTIHVAKTGCQHVAEVDAEWIRAVLRAERGSPCIAHADATVADGWCHHPDFKHRAATT